MKTAVSLTSKGRTLRCIGITSAFPGEGKTTIAANLAAQFAVSGVRTLLIDADVRNATISRHLAPGAEQGILEAINDEANLAHSVVAIESMGIDLLPVAIKTELAEAGDLLASEKMSALLNRLGETYAMIIVDLPPLRVVAESVAVSAFVDGVIVVAEWEVTPLHMLADVYHSLRKAQANVIGAVINKVNVRATEGYMNRSQQYLYRAPEISCHYSRCGITRAHQVQAQNCSLFSVGAATVQAMRENQDQSFLLSIPKASGVPSSRT